MGRTFVSMRTEGTLTLQGQGAKHFAPASLARKLSTSAPDFMLMFVMPSIARQRFLLRHLSCGKRPQSAHVSKFRHIQVRTMATASRRTEQALVTDVLTHWFGSTKVDRFDTLEAQYPLWYGCSKETDDDIRNQFGEDVELALEGGWDQLINCDRHPVTGDLALVIMLDQYARNIFRGSAKAFAGDEKGLQVASGMLAPDQWQLAKSMLSFPQLYFFLLPLMHQESLDHLDMCVEKITELIEDAKVAGEKAAAFAKIAEKSLEFAHKHRDMIKRFGRYPYRNEVLGRTSTPEELEFLEDCPRFGQ